MAVLTVPIFSKCSMEPEMAQAKPNACSMSHLNAAVPEVALQDAYPTQISNVKEEVAAADCQIVRQGVVSALHGDAEAVRNVSDGGIAGGGAPSRNQTDPIPSKQVPPQSRHHSHSGGEYCP